MTDHNEALAHFAESLRGLVKVLEHSLDMSKKIEEFESKLDDLESKVEDLGREIEEHEHDADDINGLEENFSGKIDEAIDQAVDSLTITRG